MTERPRYIGYNGCWLLATLLLISCAGPKQATRQPMPSDTTSAIDIAPHQRPSQMNRMVANPITGEIPNSFFEAMQKGSRTMSGKPGPNYWTQRARYDMDVEVIPADTLLQAHGTITYFNNSPDTLEQLYLELSQNLHKQGVVRLESAEITGGMKLQHLAIDDVALSPLESPRAKSGYRLNGTLLYLRPAQAVAPGDSVQISTNWHFRIPQQGGGGRMGYSQDNLFYIAYWYPQMRVYDDVNGWMLDAFTGNGEFYQDFASYNIDITAPAQWIVSATGRLTNGDEVLQEDIYRRLQQAHQSDSVVQVVANSDFGAVTQSPADGTVTWNFQAQNVRDFAFSLSKESRWDATRANIGDRNGDGSDDYAHINAIYRSNARLWTNGAKFTRDALSYLSDFTGIPYPWPHMTSVEGGGIIGGGMEFPMMTLIGSYNRRTARDLYSVIAHELAHMWMPMIVSTNERRYAWMDEGTTTFNELMAETTYYPDGQDYIQNEYRTYLRIAGTDLEGPIMRWSDHHYNGYAYNIASYAKPGSMLAVLRELLGPTTFAKAYRAFLDRWKYKHPYPWDFFNTFEDISGRELDWFWRAWYYETWTLDQAVGHVMATDGGTDIVIEDYGQVPMPATVEITMQDGTVIRRQIPVETWLQGATQTVITVDGDVARVVVDPEHRFPDANRANNSWNQ